MKSIGKGIVTWSYLQYRNNAKKEYNQFWTSMIRELIQNSNDANSTLIAFHLDTRNNILTVRDDGCGMDLDIIQNKLLVIGGSQKADGSVGGLGKAKELLFFSQPNWLITTNQHIIKGNGGEYEIFENSQPIYGTEINLYQPSSEMGDNEWSTVISSVHAVSARCQLKAKITLATLNNPIPVELSCSKPRGEKVRTLPEFGHLYFSETLPDGTTPESSYMSVTVNGCWMFNKYIGDYKGHAVFDIDSKLVNPVETFTANRDSLKAEFARKIDHLAEELIIDKKSAIQKKEPTTTLIRGTGEIEVGPSEREVRDMLDKLGGNEGLERFLASIPKDDVLLQSRISSFFSNTDLSRELDQKVNEFVHIMNYEPDFIIKEDPDRDLWEHSRIQKFLKSVRASTVIRVWTETLKQVMLDNQIVCRFRAGFIFSNDRAERCQDVFFQGESYLINPIFVPQTGIQNKVEFMNYMRTTAIHEITHKSQRYHDENWVLEYHRLEANTWPNHRIYATIGKLR